MANDERSAVDEPLLDNIKQIVGGVATIALIVVPIVLIRRLIRTIEESQSFKNVESGIGNLLG